MISGSCSGMCWVVISHKAKENKEKEAKTGGRAIGKESKRRFCEVENMLTIILVGRVLPVLRGHGHFFWTTETKKEN